jgi:hypothetical protein
LRTGYDISERGLSKTLRPDQLCSASTDCDHTGQGELGVDLIRQAARLWIPVGELSGQRRRIPWRQPGFVRLPVGGNETDDA